MNEKKPDLVVFNEETQQYDASVRPYGTNSSAPAIKPLNTNSWRNDGIHRVNKQLKSRFDELKKEYENLVEQFEYNDLIYNAKYNFEPIVGEAYFLYKNKRNEPFLSLIPPNECNFNFVGSFRLNTLKMWEKIVIAPEESKEKPNKNG